MAIDYRMIVGTKIDGTDIQQQIDKLPVKKIVVQPTVKGSKEIKTMTDDMGSLVTTTTKFNKVGESTGTTLSKVSTNFKDTSNQIKTASTHTVTLAGKFVDITKKVVAFGAVTSLIGTFTKLMYEAVESVKVMDNSLTELKKVTDLSGGGLENYTDQAFAMARDLKTTASDVTDAVTEFAKSNYTLEESQTLAKQAIIFQTIADGAISASDSATMLIQVMKAYNMTVSDSEHIINAINEVSNKYALSSSDLSSSIGKVASSAKTAGVDFNSLLGLMTAGTEVTQNASKTANGLKSILVNLMSDKLSKQFEQFGISMRKSNGEMKDGYAILSELANAYNNMEHVADSTGESLITTNDNMNTLLESLGGKYNINTLTAILGNFDNAVNATESAMNSAGSATDEYAVAMDSIAKKTDALKGQFQELVWGDGGLQTLIKGLIDLGTGILKFANSDLGQLAIALEIATVGVIGFTKSWTIFKSSNFGTSIIILIKELISLASGAGTTSSAITALTLSIEACPLFWGTLAITAVVGLIAIISKLNVTLDEHIEKLKELNTEYDNQLSEIDSLESQLESLRKKIEEINSENVSITDESDLTNLLLEEASLERQLLLAKEKLEIENKDKDTEAKKSLKQTSDYKEFQGVSVGGYGEYDYIQDATQQEALIGNINNLKDLQTEMQKTSLEMEKLRKEGKENSSEYESLSISLSYLSDEYNISKEKAYILASGLEEISQGLTVTDKSVEEALNYYTEYAKSVKITTDENGNLSFSINILTEEEEELSSTTESAKSSLESLNDSLDSLQSSYSLLTSIVDEYNSNQGLSIDSIQNLLSLSEEYGSALSFENGILTLNEQVLQDRANALLENAKQEVYSQTMTKLSAIAQADVSTAMKIAKGEIDATTDSLNANANAYSSAGVSAYAYSILNGQGQKASAVTKVLSDMETQITLVESAVNSMGKTFDKASGSTKSLTDSLKEQQSQYKKVIGFIKDKLNDEIDSIKEKRDAQLKAIDDEINALKDENDELENQLELQTLLENLAKAKATKVKVYREGQGFVYESDESAVSEAQQKLDEYYLKQSYDKKLADLENYKDSVEDSYNEQIDNYKNYINQFDDLTNNYENTQDALLAKQLTGIDFENQNWQTRLGNLTNFVNNYNSLQASLGGSVVNSSSGSAEAVKKPPNVPTTKKITSAIIGGGGGGGSGTRRMMAYASGVASVPDDGIAITGDNPSNRELVIGSKANGTLMNLAKGTGVVNAESTKTFAGMLNSLSKNSSISGLTSEIANSSTNNSNTSVVIQNVTLPSVTDPQSFMEWAQNYSSNMLQLSFGN